MFRWLVMAMVVVCMALGATLAIFSSPTATGYANNSITPTSTPENQELVNTLNEVIHDESCELPCWWGWNIGEDSLEQSQVTGEMIWGDDLLMGESEDYIWLDVELNETMNSEIEESLFYSGAYAILLVDPKENKLFAARFYVGYPSANYADLEPYMPAGILSKYGVPDEVTVELFSVTSPIELILRYKSLNLYVQYNVAYDAPYYLPEDYTIRLCNNLDNIIEFQLQVSISPEDINLPTGFWDNPATRNDSEFNLEKVSELSLEEFTEIFSMPNQCFETLPLNELNHIRGM